MCRRKPTNRTSPCKPRKTTTSNQRMNEKGQRAVTGIDDASNSRASSIRSIPWMRRADSVELSRDHPPAYEDIDSISLTTEHATDSVETAGLSRELTLPFVIPLVHPAPRPGPLDPLAAVYASQIERYGISTPIFLQFLQGIDRYEDEVDTVSSSSRNAEIGSSAARSVNGLHVSSKAYIEAANRDLFHPASIHVELVENGHKPSRMGLNPIIEAEKNAELIKIANELLKKDAKLQRKMYARIDAGKPDKAERKYIAKSEKAERKAKEKIAELEVKTAERAAEAERKDGHKQTDQQLATSITGRWIIVSKLQETA